MRRKEEGEEEVEEEGEEEEAERMEEEEVKGARAPMVERWREQSLPSCS